MTKNKVISFLISLAGAFCLWLYVITVVSPGYSGPVSDIPVRFEGETVLTERGLMITDGLDAYVDLVLAGNRSDYIKVNRENITVQVDLTKIYDPGVKELTYDIIFPGDVPTGALTAMNKYPETVTLTVEKKESKSVPVVLDFTGTVKDGFIPDTEGYILDYSSIKITGPSSVVNTIKSARVQVDLSNLTESISDNFRFTLCDAEGKPVDVEMIVTDVAEVHLDVKIQRWKEIPLRLDVTYGGGATEENTEIVVDPVSIRVSGSEAILADLNEIVLASVDLSMQEENSETTYTITLPEGVTNMTGKTEVLVQIKFVGLTIREFDVSQIQVVNIPEGMEHVLLNEVVKVKLRGPTVLINGMKNEDIFLTLDLAGKELGSHTVKPAITFSNEQFNAIGAVGAHGVSVELKEAAPEGILG